MLDVVSTSSQASPPNQAKSRNKNLVIFDLDGTLAESKSSLDPEMAGLLKELLTIVKVAVISGGDWPQFQQQLLANLPQDQSLGSLSLLPTCGTKYYEYSDGWKQLYSEGLTEAERARIIQALQDVVAASGFAAKETWGEVIEDRGSQITFSALGQQAPYQAKRDWDPDFLKRAAIKAVLDSRLPEFSIRMGGTTSIDITKSGIDKSYGIRKLQELHGIPISEMIFVGDALFPGGNDYPAKEAGVECIQVRDPDESKRVIETLIACLRV